MTAVVDDAGGREPALKHSLQDPKSTDVLRSLVKDDTEIRRTSEVPRTDEAITTALIWRFLITRVFATEMPGSEEATNRIKSVRNLEKLMIASAVSYEGLYAISVWRSQAIYVIVHDPQLSNDRQTSTKKIANRLAAILGVFMVSLKVSMNPQDVELQEKFGRFLREEIIEPAVNFHAELISERNLYHLTYHRYLPQFDDPIGATANTDFYRDLPDLGCLVVQARRQIPLESAVDPGVGKEELQNHLSKLCSMGPALIKRQISDKDGIGDPEILMKQKVLVLWDSEFSGTPDRTFFYELAHPTKVQESGMA